MKISMKHLIRNIAGVYAKCHQLSVWLCASLYVYTRRHTVLVVSCTLLISVVILLFQWGVVCMNIQSQWHIHRVCTDYASKIVEGSMCSLLCHNDVESLSCQTHYSGKEAVFAAKWHSREVIFKAPRPAMSSDAEALFWRDTSDVEHFPSEEEFLDMISNNIIIKFNITPSDAVVKNFSKFDYEVDRARDRTIEMRNLWFLLQQNEYVAIRLYEQYNLFPKLLGTCGSFYAVERLAPVSRFPHLISHDDSEREWKHRVSTAILILDLLAELERVKPEPLVLCDVKLNHFGGDLATTTGAAAGAKAGRLKFLDLDAVHPRSAADNIVSDGKECERDSDCDYFDCRSRCDILKKLCVHPVGNNNLQRVCERVFLGWAASSRVLVPGLLLGPRAPPPLVRALRACANPAREAGPAREPASLAVRADILNILNDLRR